MVSGVAIKRLVPTEDLDPATAPAHLREHAGKPGRVYVELEGPMEPAIFDSVVVAHGQDSSQPGGIADLTAGMQMEMNMVDGTLANLQTASGNLRVLGAAQWDPAFNDPRRHAPDRTALESGVAKTLEQAREAAAKSYSERKIRHGEKLPDHSNAVHPGFSSIAQTVPLANQTKD
jgi:hypothetical protein